MLGIFISYRRRDARGYSGRLADDLEEAFGHERVFRDIDALAPGSDYKVALARAIDSAGVVLVLIGRDWLNAADEAGQRRLDDVSDTLRHEVGSALANSSIKVIPVLLEDAQMPTGDELPSDIRALANLQALSVSDQRWRGDVLRLIDAIERIPGMLSQASRGAQQAAALRGGLSSTASTFVSAGGTVIAALLLGSSIFMTVGGGPTLFGLPAFGLVFFFLGVLGACGLGYLALVHLAGLRGISLEGLREYWTPRVRRWIERLERPFGGKKN